MQVIAWIMGEYGAEQEDYEKTEQVIEELCNQSYIGYENESTLGLIVSALAKLHIAINYAPHPKIEEVMANYSESRHLSV